MCGITGWIDWERDVSLQQDMLERMTRSLAHRGPDAEGFWLSPRAALGHRRLCVIDPQGGAQPMIYQCGEQTYVISYNGELYNFQELRSTLEHRGHHFRSLSDTEVLLHAYVEWGEDCLHHLNGIFAFAIWDQHRQCLLLARDHLGVKPLYYAQRGSALLFGSELKALLVHPLVQPEIDADGLAAVLMRPFLHAQARGIYRNVAELRAGHYALVDRTGLQIRPYWKLSSMPHPDDLPTTVAHVRELLEESVRRQLVADVPLVSLLSGGLDSSGLAALAAKNFERDGRIFSTYSMDFAENQRDFLGDPYHPAYDEVWARRVSTSIGTRHQTVVVTSEELLEHHLISLRAHDLPGMGQFDNSLYLLCKAIKGHATVALSGEAADEIFGGYLWFHRPSIKYAQTFPWLVRTPHLPALLPEVAQKVHLEAYVASQYREALAEVPRLPGEDTENERMREYFYLHLLHCLPRLLERKDRMSMATGFEVRVPYCDYRLVEYLWNVPWHMKAIDQIEKGLLRRALAGSLPEDVLGRKKSAYPTSRHPVYLSALQKMMQELLHTPKAPIFTIIERKSMEPFVQAQIPAEHVVGVVQYLDYFLHINTWLTEYHVRLCL